MRVVRGVPGVTKHTLPRTLCGCRCGCNIFVAGKTYGARLGSLWRHPRPSFRPGQKAHMEVPAERSCRGCDFAQGAQPKYNSPRQSPSSQKAWRLRKWLGRNGDGYEKSCTLTASLGCGATW